MGTHCFKKLLGTLLMGAAFSLAGTAPTLAANPNDYFQLDGNMIGGDSSRPDWSDIFTGKLPNAGADTKNPLPSGYGSATFVPDFNPGDTKDNSLFATGSKDTLNITPGWQCKKTNNVSDKTDINNAYAVALTQTVNGAPHLIVYFALDVASNDGTKDVGFWFLKDSTANCVAGSGNTNFVGNHSDGDVLIVAEFTNGGRVNEIKAYKWVGGPNGSLNPNPIGTGGECDGTAFDVCAKVNTVVLNGTGSGSGGDVPWLVKTKQSNPSSTAYDSATDLDIGEFFEGGIDLTALGISGCFNRYLADTRQSTSLTSTIFDYALGNFSNCSIGATKSCTETRFNTADNNYTSVFKVEITNTSPAGIVNDVSFGELGIPIPDGKTCTITDSTGLGKDAILSNGTAGDPTANPPIPPTNGNLVKVAETLAPNDKVTVTVSCTTNTNGFANVIHATAGSSDNLATPDITKDATSDVCSATVKGDVAIEKTCKGISLVAGNPVTLKAKVKVKVSNPSTSNEQIQIESVTDKDTSSNKIGTFTQVKSCSDTDLDNDAATPDLVLAPGDEVCYRGTYTPGTASTLNPPSAAVFTDIATVTAKGLAPGTNQEFTADSAQVSCNLCDFDLDGQPDYTDAYPQDPSRH